MSPSWRDDLPTPHTPAAMASLLTAVATGWSAAMSAMCSWAPTPGCSQGDASTATSVDDGDAGRGDGALHATAATHHADASVACYLTESLRHARRIEGVKIPAWGFLSKQPDITPCHRATAVGLIFTWTDRLGLHGETAFLAVSVMDAVLSRRAVARGRMALLAATCWWIASKYVEACPLALADVITLLRAHERTGGGGSRAASAPRHRYTQSCPGGGSKRSGCPDKREVKEMECMVLGAVDYDVARPTSAQFGRALIRHMYHGDLAEDEHGHHAPRALQHNVTGVLGGEDTPVTGGAEGEGEGAATATLASTVTAAVWDHLRTAARSYDMLRYPPSMHAAAALCLACHVLAGAALVPHGATVSLPDTLAILGYQPADCLEACAAISAAGGGSGGGGAPRSPHSTLPCLERSWSHPILPVMKVASATATTGTGGGLMVSARGSPLPSIPTLAPPASPDTVGVPTPAHVTGSDGRGQDVSVAGGSGTMATHAAPASPWAADACAGGALRRSASGMGRTGRIIPTWFDSQDASPLAMVQDTAEEVGDDTADGSLGNPLPPPLLEMDDASDDSGDGLWLPACDRRESRGVPDMSTHSTDDDDEDL